MIHRIIPGSNDLEYIPVKHSGLSVRAPTSTGQRATTELSKADTCLNSVRFYLESGALEFILIISTVFLKCRGCASEKHTHPLL